MRTQHPQIDIPSALVHTFKYLNSHYSPKYFSNNRFETDKKFESVNTANTALLTLIENPIQTPQTRFLFFPNLHCLHPAICRPREVKFQTPLLHEPVPY